MWFDNDKPYKGTRPDDDPERDDATAYADGWFDAMACILWVLVAAICAYTLVPILQPIAWALLK